LRKEQAYLRKRFLHISEHWLVHSHQSLLIQDDALHRIVPQTRTDYLTTRTDYLTTPTLISLLSIYQSVEKPYFSRDISTSLFISAVS
jgi:hypothetical protein